MNVQLTQEVEDRIAAEADNLREWEKRIRVQGNIFLHYEKIFLLLRKATC